MKPSLCLSVAVFVVAAALFASANPVASKQYVPATVLQVDKNEVWSPPYNGGDDPSDAPLRSDYYAFEVSLRVNCGTYTARYETPFDYLPAAFTPGNTVPVRVTKHILYFNVPQYPEMKMGIVHRTREQGSCVGSNRAK